MFGLSYFIYLLFIYLFIYLFIHLFIYLFIFSLFYFILFYFILFYFIFIAVALRPNAGHGLLILDVSRSHTTTQHSR